MRSGLRQPLNLPSDGGGEASWPSVKRRVDRQRPRRTAPPPTNNQPPPAENPNPLLAALPPPDYARILPELSVVPLTLKALLHKPGEALRHVYFPGGGFCSMLTLLEDGTMVEGATIGREGVIGLAAVLDDVPTTSVSMVQGASDSWD